MQPIAAGAKLAAYQNRLQGSHDFRIQAQILDLNERPVGRLNILDGQVNVQRENPKRTCNMTISDPEGALLLGANASWSGTSLWADRLVKITHTINVPGYGDITATPFVGPPVVLSRTGGEVDVELWDKSALAMYGSRPYKVPKGMNAIAAIRAIMADCTGEFRFRLPALARRLSKPYNVGWSDEASPWLVASAIARHELGRELFYSGDGYLVCRAAPTRPVTTFAHLLATPTSSVDFSQIKNSALVRGAGTVQAFRTASQGHALSPASLARRGVPRWLPLVVEDSAVKTVKQAAARASTEVAKNLPLTQEGAVTVVPMFHHDPGDVVAVNGQHITLREASIPLGITDAMTIGTLRRVSQIRRRR